MSLAIVFVLSGLALFGLGLISYLILQHRNRFQFFKLPNPRTLVLMAHPDDEVMFFGPTIVSLVDKGFDVFLLCLSSGDFDGLGSVRKAELQSAGLNLGINKKNIFVEDFQDNPDLIWDATAVACTIQKFQELYDFAAIFTFDEYGISGHKNHISLYHGASLFSRSHEVKANVYFLQTVNLMRKYLYFLDSLFEAGPQNDLYFVSSVSQVFKSISGMLSHRSQLVWFRWLYIFSSRYMFFNSYHQGSGNAKHKTLLLDENHNKEL